MKDEKRLRDILDAIGRIDKHSVDDQETFFEDEKTQDAILYNLIIIGEAANQVTEDFREKFSTIPWSSIIGTRNIITHGYDHVKLEIVWKILQEDLKVLKSEITNALRKG